MKYLIRIFFLFSFFLPFCVFAEEDAAENKTEQEEMDALRRWVREKRLITLKELGGSLSLSGEVRTEFQMAAETRNGIRQRGHNTETGAPSRGFDTEVNLMLDYRTDRTWGAIKLEFDNNMGTETGSTNNISLEKAYLGGRIISQDTFTWDAEVGRRFLLNVFDSKVEFGSLFDGLLFRFNQATESLGDFYANLAGIIVDEKKDHFAYLVELGFLRILNTGFLCKLSYIDWKKSSGTSVNSLEYNFRVSQAILGYQFPCSFLNAKLVKFYIAALYNDAAKKLDISNYQKQNWASYAGVALGQVRKKGDWAFQLNYQLVQAQAIPTFDVSGIGRGNAGKVGFYNTRLDGKGTLNTRENAVGRTNYHGWAAELLYAFTNNLTLLESFVMSWTLDKSIGPNLEYRQFETEIIYAF